MIEVVFLDFYGTLAHFTPDPESIQEHACAAEGVKIPLESLRIGYPLADKYMAQENSHWPIWSRSILEQEQFFAHYQLVLLSGAGVEVSYSKAIRIWKRVSQAPKSLELFEDALPTLKQLNAENLTVGVISNMHESRLQQLILDLNLADLIHIQSTSSGVGYSKPHPEIFKDAISKVGTKPDQALHVGDDYEGDFKGALAAGFHALWLDRTMPKRHGGSSTIQSLVEVLPYTKMI